MQQAITRPAFAATIARPQAPGLTERALRAWLDDCVETVRRAYAAATRRAVVRERLHASGRDHQLDKARSHAYADRAALAVVLGQMGRIAAAGGTLEELLGFGQVLTEAAYDLARVQPRTLDCIDLEEQRLDGHEDVLQLRRRIHGETPAALREEAELCARVAALYTERARTCRQLARSFGSAVAV